MKPSLIIFDFDGTIADTHQLLVDISNRLAGEFHFKEIKPEEKDLLKNKTSLEVIRYLHVPFLKIPRIIARAKEEFFKSIQGINPFPGIKALLIELQSRSIKLGILSSNSSENIAQFLKKENLEIFDFVISTSRVWNKNVALKKFMAKTNLDKETIFYVGDEIRDINAARKLGIKIGVVAWGYNSVKVLQKHRPDLIFSQPSDILKICQ